MPTGLDNLKHIVVLMMENRSFDHMLGSLAAASTALPANSVIRTRRVLRSRRNRWRSSKDSLIPTQTITSRRWICKSLVATRVRTGPRTCKGL